MSFIAGVVRLDREPLGQEWRQRLRSTLPDATGLIPFVHEDASALLVQMDFGAFGEPGVHRTESGVVMLAGHPFLPPDETRGSSDRGAEVLGRATPHAREVLWRRSAGNWSSAMWDSSHRELILTADRLASRPLYWWRNGPHAVFGSTFGVMAAANNLQIDYEGLLELMRLGYCLSDRTPHAGVKRLLAGEVVSIRDTTTVRRKYWDWSEWPETACTDLPERVLRGLQRAVERRLGSSRTATTFLSGGMDSRVVNQLLVMQGVRVRSFNFSRPRSRDAGLGRAAASSLGTEHHETPRRITSNVRWSALLATASRELSDAIGEQRDKRPGWAGDGGSVCAGWAYVESAIVDALRNGDDRTAISLHLARHGRNIAGSGVQPRFSKWAEGRVERAISDELRRFSEARDPARRFFLFMVENDQRRHLDAHFEDILEHRQEVWTPFLDGDVLEILLSVPTDKGARHELYHRWFHLLPQSTWSVAWQTYPGHVPCPLPVADELGYQWNRKARQQPWSWADMRHWFALVAGKRLPTPIFRRAPHVAYLGLHAVKARDIRTWIEMVGSIADYWNGASATSPPWD
jgi:hypothetical protein